MPKKIFSVIFSVFLLVIYVFTPITASAYEVAGFEITAKSAMLISLDTDEILYSKNTETKVYPAAITRIMTATVMLESKKYNPDAKIAMTKKALDLVLGTGTAVSHLKAGEEITQLDLVYMVLMSSFGDCAYLAAEYYGGSVDEFVNMMNKKAKELKLKNTNFTNPLGLHHENNYTTVKDIYTLTKYALKNSTFKTVCESARYTVSTTGRIISTTNYLQDTSTNYFYQYAKGVKTGYTDEAGRCLVSTASYNGYNYMCILMGCPVKKGKLYEFDESANLYRWAFNNFSYKEVAKSDEPICEMPVELSYETDFIPLYFEKSFVTILPNGADDSTIIVKPNLKSKVADAPIKKGDILGTADVIYAEKVIGTVNLVAGKDVSSNGWLVALRYIKLFFTSIYMKVFLVIVAIAFVCFIIICILLNRSKIKKRRVKYIPYDKGNGDKHEH